MISPERLHTDSLKWDALERRFQNPNLLPMWVADMDFQVPQAVLMALQDRITHGVFGYHQIPDSYYDAIIDWEQGRHGYTVKREWLRTVPGVVPAIFWLINAFTNPGDACLIQTPVYYPFFHAVNDTDRKLVTCDLVNTDGQYTIDFELFEQLIVTNYVKLFVLCSPHNPVGRVWTETELIQMMDICKRYQVLVVSDEIHQDLIIGSRKHHPTAITGDWDNQLITVSSATKTFNLASLENAFIVIPDEQLRNQYDRFHKTIHPGDGNMMGFVAVEAAYRRGEAWLDKLLDVVRENYRLLHETITNHLPGAVLTPLEGTYLAWCDFRAIIESKDMKTFLQDDCGLALNYGEWFGEAGRGFARMNLATSKEIMTTAMSQLTAGYQAYKMRK